MAVGLELLLTTPQGCRTPDLLAGRAPPSQASRSEWDENYGLFL